MSRPGPQRPYAGRSAADRRDERRVRLRDAGLELFGTVGFALSPVTRICRTAGLSTRQFYEEFADRDALLVAVHDAIHDDTAAAMEVALAGLDRTGLAARIDAALQVYVHSTAADPRVARVAYLEIVGVSPAVEAHRLQRRRRWIDMVVDLLAVAVAAGEIPDRDYHLTAGAFVGAVNGLLQDWVSMPERPALDEVVAELARLARALVVL